MFDIICLRFDSTIKDAHVYPFFVEISLAKYIGLCIVNLKTWLFPYKEAMCIYEMKQTLNHRAIEIKTRISSTIYRARD